MSASRPLYQQALDSLRRREGLLRVLVFTLVTIVLWIGFTIYHSQQQSTLPVNLRKHTTPLNPNINRQVLQEISQRDAYTTSELENFPIYDRILDEVGGSQLIIIDPGNPTTPSSDTTETPATETPSPEPTAAAENSASPEATTEGESEN